MHAARPATAEDLPALARLAADAVAELTPMRGGDIWSRTVGRRPPYEAGLASAVEDHDAEVVCGTIDGSVVGYAVVRLDRLADGEPIAVVDDLFTEPDARHVGVGEAMMDHVTAWARERKAVGIDALVLPGNRDTKNFFETFGLTARALVVHRSL